MNNNGFDKNDDESTESSYGSVYNEPIDDGTESETENERPDGVYPDNEVKYSYSGNDFGSYNQNPYGNGSGTSYPQPPKQKKNLVALIIAVCVAACVLMCVVGFAIGRLFDTLFPEVPETPEVEDGDGDDTDGGTQNSGTGTQTETPSELLDKDFELEQVTSEEHYRFSSVYQMTKATVVEITTESVTTGSFMQQYVTTGAGSGVLIKINEDKGVAYIVTNNHVIEGANKISVTLSDKTTVSATLIGRDEKTDLAVISIPTKIELEGGSEKTLTLSAAKLGISANILVGEEVLIIGNPLGQLGGSASSGIISATARQISIEGQVMTLLQTNAAVNPGNSGGAMFDMSGNLIGIVNAKYSAEEIEGIGFAIPIDIAKPVIEDLVKFGYVTGRANIGLTVEYGTYISSVGNTNWITEIASGSGSEKAGLKVADQIVSIDGNVFTSAEAVNMYLDTLEVGDTVTFIVKRYTATSQGFFGTQYTSETLTISFTLTEYIR